MTIPPRFLMKVAYPKSQKEVENKELLLLDTTYILADIHFPTDVCLHKEMLKATNNILDIIRNPLYQVRFTKTVKILFL